MCLSGFEAYLGLSLSIVRTSMIIIMVFLSKQSSSMSNTCDYYMWYFLNKQYI